MKDMNAPGQRAGRDGPPEDAPVLSRQGRRTRTALLRAARQVFEQRGYQSTRIEDITEQAGYAVGSFYTYFESKEEIFARVLEGLGRNATDPSRTKTPSGSLRDGTPSHGPVERIHNANASYLTQFGRTARLWAAVEEAALSDAGARQLLLDRWRAYRQATIATIGAWQEEGRISSDVDVSFTVIVLSATTEWLVSLRKVYGHQLNRPPTATSVTALWADALGLSHSYRVSPPNSAQRPRAPQPQGAQQHATAGRKAARTRATIVTAADTVFRRDGFSRSRITDIAQEAGVAVGTIYRYIDTKEELLEELLITHRGSLVRPWQQPLDAPAQTVRNAIHTYLDSFSRNAETWRTVAEGALVSKRVRTVVNHGRTAFIDALHDAFMFWKQQGQLAPDLDAVHTSEGLAAMTERCAHLSYILGDSPSAVSSKAEALSQVWLRVLRQR